MSETTAISWCDSTVNFWEGCTKVSPACDHCYAERKNKWLRGGENWGPGAPRRLYSTAPATVRSWQRNAAKFRASHGRDRRVFVNSTSDWLDNEVPIEWLVTLLDTVREARDVTFLLLSKRIGNWRKRLEEARVEARCANRIDLHRWIAGWLDGRPPPNVWIMTTVVTQEEVDRDVVKLFAVPARVRGLSIEPMLGPVDLREIVTRSDRILTEALDALRGELTCVNDHGSGRIDRCARVDWVIAGGESGPRARPAHPDWFRSLRDQCAAAGVPFHFKQWGAWAEFDADGLPGTRVAREGDPEYEDHAGRCDAFMRSDGLVVDSMREVRGEQPYRGLVRLGKAAAGRLLDGVEHNGFPA